MQTIHKDEAWDSNKRFYFKIVTSDMNYEDRSNFDLKLKFSDNMKHEFWRNKVLPDVRVSMSADAQKNSITSFKNEIKLFKLNSNYLQNDSMEEILVLFHLVLCGLFLIKFYYIKMALCKRLYLNSWLVLNIVMEKDK